MKTFLIKAENNRECVMRLPTNKYGGITHKGFQMIRTRFYDGATDTYPRMNYALNLEAFSSGKSLMEALEKYHRHEV